MRSLWQAFTHYRLPAVLHDLLCNCQFNGIPVTPQTLMGKSQLCVFHHKLIIAASARLINGLHVQVAVKGFESYFT